MVFWKSRDLETNCRPTGRETAGMSFAGIEQASKHRTTRLSTPLAMIRAYQDVQHGMEVLLSLDGEFILHTGLTHSQSDGCDHLGRSSPRSDTVADVEQLAPVQGEGSQDPTTSTSTLWQPNCRTPWRFPEARGLPTRRGRSAKYHHLRGNARTLTVMLRSVGNKCRKGKAFHAVSDGTC